MFKFVLADLDGNIYAVNDTGDLLYYHDQARNGTANWAFGGVGQKIGSGWADFLQVFSGGNGIIYAIAQNGDLLYYRDLARNGTVNWAYGGTGQKIGSGWQNFRQVICDGSGVIYAIAQNGDLLYYRDQSRDGTANWAFGGIGQQIGNGWNNFRQVFGGDGGIIYAITPRGDLLYYRDQARNGTANWAFGGIGQQIGSGWSGFWTVCSGGGGIVYAITNSGDLLFYRDHARNGTFGWDFNGTGQKIGSGWNPTGLEGYCWPLSAAPGETIEFKISAPSSPFNVTYLRLKTQPDRSLGTPMGAPAAYGPAAQTTAADWVSNGCNWSTTFSLQVPADWQSGIYAAYCADNAGNQFYITFIVKPVAARQGAVLALASTNTWTAYNGWGGYSKYGPNTPVVLTCLRPNPATSPVDDGVVNHLTRADLWILNWIEEAGYVPDVITDTDLHQGFSDLGSYGALVLTSHPEYWSMEMMDAVQAYLNGGGSVLYLGGNGMFERCIFSADATSLTFFNGSPSLDRAAAYFRNLQPPRPERGILGVAFRYDYSWGGDPSTYVACPYKVMAADHPLFAGTGVANGDLIGQTGRQGVNGGGVSGWEMDTSNAGDHSDDGVEVGAAVGNDRGVPPANLQLLGRGTNSATHAADLTYYDTGNGGFVFSAGSICFGGSLVEDANLQTIVRNALNQAIAGRPLAAHG
jgi:hypothetical protein